jgi:hypothetical protein
MSLKSIAIAAAATMTLATGAFAEMSKIMVQDAYARASNAKAGAAFMQIMNHSGEDDRLIGVTSEVSARTELHTHKDMGEGVMKMMHVEEGFAIPAGATHALQRGGDHVMFMGLNAPFEHGSTVTVTLVFEKAGEVTVDVPVDLERKAAHGGMKHGEMDHSSHSN